jgi:hypothetical protein
MSVPDYVSRYKNTRIWNKLDRLSRSLSIVAILLGVTSLILTLSVYWTLPWFIVGISFLVLYPFILFKSGVLWTFIVTYFIVRRIVRGR